MIQKTYYVGQFSVDCNFAGGYFLGIHRRGEGTLPFSEPTVNGIKHDVTSKYLRSFEILRGYLIAVNSELRFEGTDNLLFKVKTRNWNDDADNIFREYLTGLSEFAGNIRPLKPGQIRDLSTIVGLNFE